MNPSTPRHCLQARPLLLLLIAGLAAVSISCATQPRPVDLSAIEVATERLIGVPGAWRSSSEGLLSNVIPEGVSQEDLIESRDGLGVSLGLIPGFYGADLLIECEVETEGTGAAGLVFRAQEDAGVITGMFCIVLYRDGVNLWECIEDEWALVHKHRCLVKIGMPHLLRARVSGDTIAVSLNGEPLFNATAPSLMAPGRAGIRALQGQCHFRNLRVKPL